MSLDNRPNRYGGVPITIHWTTGAAILGLVMTGFQAANMADPAAKITLLRVHAVLGITVLMLTLLRILWWTFMDNKPASPSGMPRWQARTSRIVHMLFYIVIFGMVASGIRMLSLAETGTVLLSDASASLPNFTSYPPRLAHGIGGRFLIALIILHAAAAFYHQFSLRDRLLARMGIGR